MASIYKEGAGWSARVRMNGKSGFKGGFKRRSEAADWARATELAFLNAQPAKGMGPTATSLAVALRDYAYDFVVTQKGAKHVLSRINGYLSEAGLPILHIAKPADGSPEPKLPPFLLAEKPLAERTLPRTFGEYRQARLNKRCQTIAMRQRLAAMPVGKIAPHHIHDLKKAMTADGYSTSSINNELSILSAFFTNANKIWQWSPLPNPCDEVKRDAPNNARNRVLSAEEQQNLGVALAQCKNPYVAPYVWLAIETAMRKGEMLLTATWDDIDWARRILTLRDAKGGGREVPLTLAAIGILNAMPNRERGGRIFEMTADALDSAWERACKRANIHDLTIHDLRHTSATRHAKRLNGDIFLLKLITGHKTLSMLARYVNPNVNDVVAAFDEQYSVSPPPAGPTPSPTPAAEPVPAASNVIQVTFPRRRIA